MGRFSSVANTGPHPMAGSNVGARLRANAGHAGQTDSPARGLPHHGLLSGDHQV
jgi:hypothetical protein